MTMRRSCIHGAIAASVAAAAVMAGAASSASPDLPVRIWKIGSPYRGDTPAAVMPRRLAETAAELEVTLVIEGFPARGFAALFDDAVSRDAAPDVLVFDNFGVIEGITTPLGTFDGIGRSPVIQRDLIKVTGALDELLGVQRGWTYLVASSPNHRAARALAVDAPGCPEGPRRRPGGEIEALARRLAVEYLGEDTIALQASADMERLVTASTKSKRVNVAATRLCTVGGNARLAFAQVAASYSADASAGHALVLLVLRHRQAGWQLLAASRDPISNGAFLREVASVPFLDPSDTSASGLPAPALLLAPLDGRFPERPAAERFGSFAWQPSASAEVVTEIVEFAYEDDARLILHRHSPLVRGQVSAGRLWTTGGDWRWRVWSVTREGEVAFSGARTFVH